MRKIDRWGSEWVRERGTVKERERERERKREKEGERELVSEGEHERKQLTNHKSNANI